MDYVKLGASGVKVSKLCLGMMSYGTAGWPHHPWVLSEADAQPFLKGALDAGINFFDTADFYSAGASEEILGNFVKANMKRSDAVIATKVCLTMGDGPNDKGLSRKHIMEAIDASLARLKTDYVDLLYIHRLDHDTPMEEMAEALNDVVRSGRALYLGASSMWAWQFAKLREMQRANGWARFAVMQNFYNLCYREEEREMIPYCKAEGVALVPWSPMARGFLAGNRPKGEKGATARGQTDKLEEGYFGSKQDYAILARVEKLADKLGVKPAQVALAWVLAKGVTSPIVGATKPHHLSDAVAALDIKLTDAQIASLEAPYAPRAVQGHS
jgi:aryl-alcohol dehydrogenase-like predicted oxidoreductase